MMVPQPRVVLIVHGSVADRETISRYLEADPDQTYTLYFAERGNQALEQCRNVRPDCVVAGQTLADMDVLAFIADLHAVVPPPIPVVLLADADDEAVAAQALRQGAHDYLVTGSSPQRVRLTVHNAIEGSQLRARLARQHRELEASIADNASLVAEREELLAKEREARRVADESLALLDTLVESAPAGLGFIDRDLRYVRVNKALAVMNALPAAAHLGQRAAELFGSLGAEWERQWRTVIASGEPLVNLEVSALLDGQHVYALTNYYPVRDRDGSILGVGCVVTHISERKRAEIGQRMLAAAGSALSASLDEDTLGDVIRALFPNLADYGAIHLFDELGRLSLAAVAHYDAELEPQVVALLGLDDPATYGNIHPIAHAVATGQTVIDALKLPAGTGVDESACLQPATSVIVPLAARGRHFGALTAVSVEPGRRYMGDEIAVIEELARRCALAIDAARLYAEAQQAKATAEAAVELRDRFISIAAHELKTPLAVLLGNAQLLLRRVEQEHALDVRRRRNLEIVVAQALRLNRLIAALLDISRLERGRLTIMRAPLDLRQLAYRLAEELTPTLTRHIITVEAPDNPVMVHGDELRLEQVIQNLLHNAIKYSPQGGEVQLVVSATESDALLTVSDQGIGIPEQDLPQLFERYFRASNVEARRITGMGFGLYVVQEIVERHGGSVEVTSIEGGGSTFTVRLTLLETPPAEETTPVPDQP